MRLRGDDVAGGSVRDCDVCIIGSGAAGISLGRELIGSNRQVILLEAGGFEWTEESQESYKAEAVNCSPGALDIEYPDWSRLRYFGGSTNHWGGWCRPFDEQDFNQRPWVNLSGWPITRRELAPYYERAQTYLQLEPFDLEGEMSGGGADPDCHATAFPLTRESGVATRFFHYSPPTRFGELYRQDLLGSPNVEVILNGNAVRFDALESGLVEKVLVKNSKGEEFTVRARIFILACGGLENPRLLLNSDHQRPAGLGNDHDMVGRCFMEHPHSTVGVLCNLENQKWHKPFTGAVDLEPMRIFTTTAKFQEDNRLLNFSCQLLPTSHAQPDDSVAAQLGQFNYDKNRVTKHLTFYTRSEMEPNLSNRVRLGSALDQQGLRRLVLDVNFGDRDLHSVVRSTEEVIRVLSAQGLGRGKITLETDTQWSADLGPGCHHMGTTRMSYDPRTGVVDRDLKVHGLQNMYIAGSSVFATSAYANPTFTITALALRLADHLKQRGFR